MRQLIILRHAKSDWDSDAVTDFDRPLSGRGRRDGARVGAWLARMHWLPDLILCSPAKRTRQTAALACRELGISEQLISYDPKIYASSPGTLLHLLNQAPNTSRRLMLVSHNPESEQLVRLLSDTPISTPADGKLITTATTARFEFDGDWNALQPGRGRLLSIMRPTELPES